jgi:putative ABC transport system ATP-binding protein
MAPPGRGLVVSGLRSARLGPVSFSLGPAQCMAVMGASGAGKTLLLRLLADLDPGEGDVVLDGEARNAMPAALWRSRVVFVPAVSGWWATDVAEHFDAGTLSAATSVCRTLCLPPDIMDRAVLGLSTGERQRLAIVRALMVSPRVLLLDEPSSGLDPGAALAMESCLHEARERGTAIVLVTHDVAQARRMAAREYRLECGTLVVQP